MEKSTELMPIEAMGMKSGYMDMGGDHVCVFNKEKTKIWTNGGVGPDAHRQGKHIVAKDNAYKEWLLAFCPTGDGKETGVRRIGLNGVCQTRANRELLVTEEGSDVRDARRNDTVTFILGKYGYGLDDLVDKLKKAHNGSEQILTKVIHRVRHAEMDELNAWKRVLSKYIKMPVERIIEKGGSALRTEALKNHAELIKNREEIYKRNIGVVDERKKLHTQVYGLLRSYCSSGLAKLESHGLISSSEREVYGERIKEFLKNVYREINVEYHYYQVLENNLRSAETEVDHSWIDEWE